MKENDRTPEILWAGSIYGANTRKGLVQIVIGSEERLISPEEAREFALSIFEAAESAETDEFLMTWLQDQVGQKDDSKNARILAEFRQWREHKRALHKERNADH